MTYDDLLRRLENVTAVLRRRTLQQVDLTSAGCGRHL